MPRDQTRSSESFMSTWLYTHPLRLQVMTLISASLGGLAMAAAWWMQHGPPLKLWRTSYSLTPLYLVINLLLAWVPLLFALAIYEFHLANRAWGWRFLLLFGGWLLFFPNAPYLCTDLCHLPPPGHEHFWIDLALILWFSITGLQAGFFSLFIVHTTLARRLGQPLGWVFVGIACVLGSFGTGIGRFLRLYSWDIITNPETLWKGILGLAANDPQSGGRLKFLILFALLLFNIYLMLHALTQLNASAPAPQPASAPDEG